MAELIAGKSANEVWEKAVNHLRNEKETVPGRNGDVYELLHMLISIEDPKQKWVYSRVPPMSIGFALAELIWIMNGEADSRIINYWNPSLKKYAGNHEYYYGAYGKRIRSHYGFDQLNKAYQALQNVPESRQVVIQIYDTKIDFPIENGKPRDEDIPCNICSLLKIRQNKLEWSQTMRSNDVLLGLPYNFIQFTGLQEIVAGWLEIDTGTYNHYSDSLHLYLNDAKKIGIHDGTDIKNTDSLALKKGESEGIFKEIYNRMRELIKKDNIEKDIYTLGKLDSEFLAYNNILFIISAYVAHKRRMYDLETELIKQCTNDLYCDMWDKWINR